MVIFASLPFPSVVNVGATRVAVAREKHDFFKAKRQVFFLLLASRFDKDFMDLLISVALSPKDSTCMVSVNQFVFSEKSGNLIHLDGWQP